MADKAEQEILATVRTLLALERNYLAEERTELAKFRTGLAIGLIIPPSSTVVAYVSSLLDGTYSLFFSPDQFHFVSCSCYLGNLDIDSFAF